MSKTVMLYTKETCALCDEAYAILEDLQTEVDFTIETVDIYQDEALLEKFMVMIPVVEVDGEIIDYGRVSRNNVRKRLL
ncbi:glutaredoxin family protein [Guptibacillus algicola]|uniref:glutaredoxin family protein n=1 Tax=Guptibacillus algicola TaxID=225844 RepID=UPI001CD5D5CC|nr:glutaredoxin family protein [Alkalihalobacillus algicola]MCA0986794.1 glutaredoxin family protein [Alkalihalobacillus algicola]